MKRIKWVLLLIIGVTTAATSCKKSDDNDGIIDVEQLTNYIWKGEEYGGSATGYMVNSRVTYNFSKDLSCTKQVINSTDTVYNYKGKWRLGSDNKLYIAYPVGLPDHRDSTREEIKIVSLTDNEFVFKRPSDNNRMSGINRKFSPVTKVVINTALPITK